MAESVQDFADELFAEVRARAAGHGQFLETAYLEQFGEWLVEAGDFETFDIAQYRAARGMRVDAYGGDPAENEGVLSLAVADFSTEETVGTLTKTEVEAIFRRLENFLRAALTGAFEQLEESAKGYGLAELIVATRNGNAVRLRDVAQVEDSFETVKTSANLNGETSITLAVLRQPDANTVRVVDSVRAMLPALQSQLPQSVRMTPVNDRSRAVREAIHDVSLTLLGTLVLVVLVMFLFLRRVVATVIPSLSLPVSLMGAVALLWGLGYTVDNVSLLGLTLAVGLVVDDAIVMLENIMRHVEEGMPPFEAALKGSREVGFTIISISTSLVAVFIPIFFMPGVIGLLFHEFAVIVSLAIVVSAFVSLTLVPMLAGRYLSDEAHKKRPGALVRSFERGFDAMLRLYTRSLDAALAHRRFVLGNPRPLLVQIRAGDSPARVRGLGNRQKAGV